MGVVESSQGLEQELNLHDLAIGPESKKPKGFDAREFVTDEDWKRVDKIRDAKNLPLVSQMASLEEIAIAAKIAFPDKSDDSLNAAVHIDTIIGHYSNERSNWFTHHQLVRDFLHPNNSGTVNWVEFAILFRQQLDGHVWGNVNEIFPILKLTHPSECEELCRDYPNLYDNLRENLEKLRGTDWPKFAEQAAVLRLMEPKKLKKLAIDQTTWKGMTTALEGLCGTHISPENFFRMAANMQILAAEDVVFDKNNLHLVMPERQDFKEPKPNLPVRKQF